MAASLVIGVDPGAAGAFACLSRSPGRWSLHIHPMPTLIVRVGQSDRRRVDLVGTHNLGTGLATMGPDLAVMEDVQGFGGVGQSASAAFVFGRATAAAEMALIAGGVSLNYVKPARWKKELGLNKNKDNALVEAMRLFPEYAELFTPRRMVRDKEQCIGNAEAALIAYYGITRLLRVAA